MESAKELTTMTEAETNALKRIAKMRLIKTIYFYAITFLWVVGIVVMAVNHTYPPCYAFGVLAVVFAVFGVVTTRNYLRYRRDIEERLTGIARGNIKSILFLNGVSYLLIDKKLYAFKGRNRGKFRMAMDVEIVYSRHARHILSKIIDGSIINLV